MRNIHEVLRLDAGDLSNRQIATSLLASKTTIRNCLRRAAAAGFAWPLPTIERAHVKEMDAGAIELERAGLAGVSPEPG